MTSESLLTFTALLRFRQLISASLLKIYHGVVTHLIARAMLTQNPASEFDTKFLDHFYLLLVNLKCKRKTYLLLSVDQKIGGYLP